ncbi:ribulose phosphate epimerase [Nannocystis pusilla]
MMHTSARFITLFCAALLGGCSDSDPNATGTPTTTDDTSTSTTEPGESSNTTPTSSGTTGSTTVDDPTSSVTDGEASMCDPWQQDCPDGYKCMAFAPEGEPAFTGNKCTPVVENPGKVGDPCKVEDGWWSGVDDCDYGLACWNINHADNTGQCVALCTGNEDAYDCPGSADICVFWIPGIAHVCLQGCDPLLQDCPTGQGCLPDWASNGQRFVCLAEYSFEEGQEFDPCQFSNVCDPGLLCWGSESALECDQDISACCLSFCDISDPQCTGQGAECVSFYEGVGGEPPPAFADVGICVIPG